MPLNTQPVFSFEPFLKADTIDAVLITDNSGPTPSPDTIYTSLASYGAIVTKITVSACGDLSNDTVDAKLVYIYIRTAGTGTWALRYNASMPATTITTSTVNPVITFEPTGGILLKYNDSVGIGVSENYANSSRKGNFIAYTVEGSTF
jgi:hypothetical protein